MEVCKQLEEERKSRLSEKACLGLGCYSKKGEKGKGKRFQLREVRSEALPVSAPGEVLLEAEVHRLIPIFLVPLQVTHLS